MRCLIVLALVSAVLAAPSKFDSAESAEFFPRSATGYGTPAAGFGPAAPQPAAGYGGAAFGGGAGFAGPTQITKSIYVFESPEKQFIHSSAPIIPPAKLHNNIIYIKTPEIIGNNDPIIIPPSQTKTTLYVLSKNGQQGQQIIQFAEGPQTAPEVFYVHYNEGENPTLPNGIDLENALASANSGIGQSIGGGFGAGIGQAGGAYGAPAAAPAGYGAPAGAGIIAAKGYTSGIQDDSFEISSGGYPQARPAY